MSSVSKTLSTDVGTFKKKRSLTPDVLKGRSVSVSESLEMQVRVLTFNSDNPDNQMFRYDFT